MTTKLCLLVFETFNSMKYNFNFFLELYAFPSKFVKHIAWKKYKCCKSKENMKWCGQKFVRRASLYYFSIQIIM